MSSKTGKSSRKQGNDEKTDYRIYRLTARDRIREGAVGAGIFLAAAYTFYRSLGLSLILMPVGALIFPVLRKGALKEKRDWRMRLEFREAIWLMSGFMSAGMSPENALMKTIPELEGMFGAVSVTVREFKRMAEGIRMNVPMEKLLMDYALRSGIDDIRNFAEVFAIVKRNGGNMREIVEKTTDVIRDKMTVAEEIMNMTASRRYEQNIMNLLPFVLILYIDISSGDYLNIMYESPAGRIVMTFCLILLCVSYILSQKILNIRV